MNGKDREARWRSQEGFTVIEMIVYFVIAVVLIGAIYQLLIGQSRLYSKERELTDVRSTLRAAAEILSVEIRMSSAADGDIIAFDADSIVLRSVQASGVVCGVSGNQLGVAAASGEFLSTPDDSVMLYSIADDTWGLTTIDSVYVAGGGDVPTCSWGAATESVVKVGTVPAGVDVGSELRAYRRVSYAMIQESDGRWWLGRKTGSSGSYEKMVGPLLQPSDSGLALYYYNASGAPTSVPADVKLVEMLLRAASLGKARQTGGDMAAEVDSLRTRVVLRG